MVGRDRCLLLASFMLIMTGAKTARILLVPVYHYSHVNFFATAAGSLKQDGHEVTMLLSDEFLPAAAKSHVAGLPYHIPGEFRFQNKLDELMESNKSAIGHIYQVATELFPLFNTVCELILQNATLLTEIQTSQFDLVIMDAFPELHCLYVIPYKFNIQYISLSVMHDPWSAGVPAMPGAEPIQMLPFTNHMSFGQRLIMTAAFVGTNTLLEYLTGSKYYVEKYAPERPSTSCSSLYKKSDLFLINHEITCLDYPRVSAPNYQFIGGCSASAAKPLPDDLQEFADNAKDGLIVVSFGSLTALQKLWKQLKNKMIYALEKMPKVRAAAMYALDDAVHNFPPNVKVLRWLPQNDLLGHPNVRLFITHGGNNGQLESTYHGVPMLVMPVAADQRYNGIRAEHHGYGRVVLDKEALTAEQFYDLIKELLTNKTYADNIGKCSRIIRSQPSPQEKVVYWVNHVLQFGGAHLRPPTADMPLYQMFMFDVLLFLTAVGILIGTLSLLMCRLFLRKCCRKSQPGLKEKKQ